jgi:hypothetical protein
MKTFARKGAVLFASTFALAAFAMPAVSSAAVWGVGGTSGNLNSGPFTTNVPGQGWGWTCSSSHLGYHVRGPASSTLDITAATYSGCVGTGGLRGPNCAFTLAATGLPWTAVGTTVGNVSLNIANIDVTMTGTGCAFGAGTLQESGTVAGGAWSAPGHSVTYNNVTGLSLRAGGAVVVAAPAVTLSSMFVSNTFLTLT